MITYQETMQIYNAFHKFEGSHDAEDCSNDAENTDEHHRNKLQFKVHSNRNPVF